MNEVKEKVNQVSALIQEIKDGNESYDHILNSTSSNEESARISLGLAFTINSLFYCKYK